MNDSFIEAMPSSQLSVQARPGAAGLELTPAELDAVHGGELKIEMPAYVPFRKFIPRRKSRYPGFRTNSLG